MKPRAAPPVAGNDRRALRLGLVAAATGVIAGAVCFAPARLLALLADQASGEHLRLDNARGTVWNGQADLVLAGGRGSAEAAALPQGLRWRLAPAWDGGPALALKLDAPCCTPQGLMLSLSWKPGSWQLKLPAHQSLWPAGWLAGLGSPWNTIRLQGRLQLQTPGLGIEWVQGRARLTGPFELQAQDVGSSLSTLKPLGSYRLRFAPDAGGSPLLQLDTLRGELKLSGEGQWSGSRLRFRGVAEADSSSQSALSNLLNILGRREGPRAVMTIG